MNCPWKTPILKVCPKVAIVWLTGPWPEPSGECGMSKSPAALHWPKKEKQTSSRKQVHEERPYGINAVQERPLPTPASPPKRTLGLLLSKFL